MPSPNGARKIPANKTPETKAVDLGPKLARKRSQDFKSKIAGWNQGGAGVAQPQDEIVVVEEKCDDVEEKAHKVVAKAVENASKESVASSPEDVPQEATTPTTPKTPVAGPKIPAKQSSKKKASREIDAQRQAWVKKKPKPAVDVSADVKQAVAPKKRIVSDGHWRKDKPEKKEATTTTTTPEKEKDKEKDKSKEKTPKPVTVRRSVVSVGLKVPPSIQAFEEPEPVRVRPLTRRSRSRSQSRDRDATPDYESSGTKVYIKRRRRSKTTDGVGKERKDLNSSTSSFTAPSSIDKPSTATDLTTPDASPIKENKRLPYSDSKIRTSRELLDLDSGRKKSTRSPPEFRDAPRRPSQRNTMTPVKDEKKPPTPIPKVFGNRIEGWLAGMAEDPFLAPSELSSAADPTNVSRRVSRRAEDVENREEYDLRKDSGRSKRTRPSLEPLHSNEQPRSASYSPRYPDEPSSDLLDNTPTLKRSGARRSTYSPVKERPLRASGSYLDDNGSPGDINRRTSRRLASGNPYDLKPRTRLRAPSPGSDLLDGSVLSRASDGDDPGQTGTGLKRRLTKHSDLMSVLSLAREDENGIPIRRSTRRRRQADAATIGDLMNGVTTDELKYQRELRTLVEGVIPVLLQYVLSKNNAPRQLGSRHSAARDHAALTQPIVDMGAVLERLKTNHKRIPMHDPNELLLWAQSTSKVYSDYLKVWRLGFQDIVVNLAPAEETKQNDPLSWDNDLERDQKGDLLTGDGQRVDVAFLLKRPLVRLKHLQATFKGINQLRPSALAEDMTSTYQELTQAARQRSNAERARLEDEEAAAIDPSRARDPRTLAPLSGVSIDPTRGVRARDYFDLELFHSNGQQLGCKVELIVRDDPLDRGTTSDVLICEITTSGRWLLFPPMLSSFLSARKGDKEGEIVVMLRGPQPSGDEWREIVSLQSNEEQCGEWIDILGSNPLPPRLSRQSSFNALRRYDAPPSPTESELPIGERAQAHARRWDGSDVNNVSNGMPTSTHRGPAKRYRNTMSSPVARDDIDRAGQDENIYNSGYHQKSSYKQRPTSMHTTSTSDWGSETGSKKDYSVWLPSSDRDSDGSSADEDDRPARRPTMHRRTSSVPSMDMPTISKLRKGSPNETQDRDLARQREKASSKAAYEETIPTPTKRNSTLPTENISRGQTKTASKPLSNARPTSLGLRTGALPTFTPAFMKHRRSSSPLKHEYEPSTATESSSDSELSDVQDDVESVTSDSAANEAVSVLGDLQDFRNYGKPRPLSQSNKPRSAYSMAADTVGPSESASQAPYRSVPPSNNGAAQTVAGIFSWSDKGSWDRMHPEECEIVVSPGLIEAFDLAQAHAVSSNLGDGQEPSPSTRGVKPLVALELTLLVPMRRGTALDISMRSPPTANSVYRQSSNIMFRSRTPEECEKLYGLINRARINNPTYAALQNARGPVPTSNWAEAMDRRNAARSSKPSWMKSLSRRGSSYRSKATRTASVAGSQSSVGTMGTAFSALRKFSGGKMFNITKSTIMSKDGTRSSNSDSLSSGAATPITIDAKMGTPIGLTNANVRLYVRESASRWRDQGSARLSIMLPPRPDPSLPADPRTTGLQKRVLVVGKSRGETLLDVTLGESSFERIARTGIAVNICEDHLGPNGEFGHAAATGGVVSTKTTIYMIQMKSERDAAYTFSMVGKLRY